MTNPYNAVALLLAGAVLTFIATWYWKRRDKSASNEEKEDTVSAAERGRLASDLETLRRDTANRLESQTREEASRLAVEQKSLVGRIDTFEKAMIASMAELKTTVATLTTQVSPLWAAVQSKIAKDLTHPHVQFKEMDELLVKLEALTISDEERDRLHDLLIERSTSQDPEVNDEERASATLMIGIMEKVLAQAADPSPITNVILVGISDSPDAAGVKEEVKA